MKEEGVMSEFWTVRSGKFGERTAWAFSHSLLGGGWTEVPDLTFCKSREDVAAVVSEVYQGSKHVLANYTGQLWRLRSGIQVGHYVVLPVRSTSQIAIGKVTKGYHYLKDEEDLSKRHVLGVDWLKTDIPRSSFKQDLLYQMGSALTVFKLANDDAPYRFEQVLAGKLDPGSRSEPQETGNEENFDESPSLDIEYIAESSIAKIIEEDFKGHDLSELVTALLTAEGYVCRNSPAGPDGGVDIV
jgi:restriction system protein